MHILTMFGCLLADWLDLFTDEVIVVRDTVTRIEYDPGSPIRAGDWAIYTPSWYTVTHTGDPCSAAMIFYENAHDAHDYGGVVLEDANGLYVEVNLEMTTETANPLITPTADSVLASTYELCWVNTVFTLEPSHIPHISHIKCRRFALAGPSSRQRLGRSGRRRAAPQAPNGMDSRPRRLYAGFGYDRCCDPLRPSRSAAYAATT